jgi:hypothetical protein
MLTRIWTGICGVVIAGALATGCGSVENAIDCHGICARYQTCFDSKYDVDACTSRCRDNAGKDPQYSREADSCNDCIDDKSCASATFTCGTDCAGIVP